MVSCTLPGVKPSNATLQSDSALLLAPFSVLPGCARRSVCTALENQSDLELTRRRPEVLCRPHHLEI